MRFFDNLIDFDSDFLGRPVWVSPWATFWQLWRRGSSGGSRQENKQIFGDETELIGCSSRRRNMGAIKLFQQRWKAHHTKQAIISMASCSSNAFLSSLNLAAFAILGVAETTLRKICSLFVS